MSWSRQQAATFAEQGAALRRQVSGTPFTWSGAAGKTFCGVFSAVTERREIEAAGFELQPSSILRVQASAFPTFLPALGQTITTDGQPLMVIEIAWPVAGSDEIRVGLGKP